MLTGLRWRWRREAQPSHSKAWRGALRGRTCIAYVAKRILWELAQPASQSQRENRKKTSECLFKRLP